MSQTIVVTSAPGSIMLTGEHAVLYGHKAVIASIDKKISVSLSIRRDNMIVVKSRNNITKIEIDNIGMDSPPKNLIKSILFFYKYQIKSGLEIKIISQIPESKGLGSSTALLVSFVAAIKFFLYQKINNQNLVSLKKKFLNSQLKEVFLDSKMILTRLNLESSCADIMSSIYGGIILYKKYEIIKNIFTDLNLILIFSGYKTKTSDVLSYIQPLRQKFLNIFLHLETTIGHISEMSFEAIESRDFDVLGNLFSINQGILEAMKLSTPLIDYLINRLKDYQFIKGSKISGAGLGDSIIALCTDSKDIKSLHIDLQKISFTKINISKTGLELQ